VGKEKYREKDLDSELETSGKGRSEDDQASFMQGESFAGSTSSVLICQGEVRELDRERRKLDPAEGVMFWGRPSTAFKSDRRRYDR